MSREGRHWDCSPDESGAVAAAESRRQVIVGQPTRFRHQDPSIAAGSCQVMSSVLASQTESSVALCTLPGVRGKSLPHVVGHGGQSVPADANGDCRLFERCARHRRYVRELRAVVVCLSIVEHLLHTRLKGWSQWQEMITQVNRLWVL